ncbi:hypothetical protein [Aureimonas leprariae]|uniref:hypothetical protein n=1 Tax=Plantimonas leprariae TaxID=2615207 RepID=UPI001AEE67DE|nr:hypothetical protein [Aureimonas leprariae]
MFVECFVAGSAGYLLPSGQIGFYVASLSFQALGTDAATQLLPLFYAAPRLAAPFCGC